MILIQLFGGYSVSEVLHVQETLDKCYIQGCRAHAKVAGRLHGVSCHMQGNSFLVEREC